MNHNRLLKILAGGFLLMLAFGSSARAADVSPPVILQYFESQWSTMEKRLPDVFMAGYGAVWTPPPGRSLYDDQGGGIGYNLYDRFDLGKAGDRTAYGTEKGYRTLIDATHRLNGDVYVDYIHHHVGSWDLSTYTGDTAYGGSYTPPGSAHVADRSDYPGFELSDAYAGAAGGSNYRNASGHRDSYPDPPPLNDGGTPQYQYQYRLAHLITIDLTSDRAFVRNPVPGNGNNIRQASASNVIATSTLLSNGQVGGATISRQANTPTDDNKRFYPDNDLAGITVTDPLDGNQSFTIHPYNTANPSAGDPSSETLRGYMMRYAQWLVNDIGVDGLRIDAARHVPYGQTNDAYNPASLNIPALVDRAVYRESKRYNLDGTQRTVFSFQEVFSGDKNLLHTFVRKDINPNTPNVVGGNRDVLDFPMWFAMRSNFTSNGLNNNWYNVRYASQDSADDGLSTNGSESIGFVINHDDGRGNSAAQGSDYIYLDNVAHAWILTKPGNAYVYFNSHEFDRTGNNEFFLKDGRGDALGGQYGSIVTNLVDIRNSYGRGNFQERWIDGGSSAVYAFERLGSMIVGLNIGFNPGSTSRTVNTSFGNNVHLVELTGNWQDPSGTIPRTIVTNGSGQATINIPWNNTSNGNKGYVIYGLPRPQGSIALTNVSQTLAGSGTNAANNATSRINDVSVITANSFYITLNTTKVTLSDGYHDQSADGDNALLRMDGGLDLNGNNVVDNTNQALTSYGFENFVTTHSPGYNASEPLSGNGTYAQTINAANLSEGYHYITARAYRQRSDGGPAIFTDFRKVVYIDRLAPTASCDYTLSTVGNSRNLNVLTHSLDLTADNVNILLDLGANMTDAQVLALINGGSATSQTDRDLFSKDFTNLTAGTHVVTTVTREITGNYSILRATGLQVGGTFGFGFGDLDANGLINSSDISQFQTVLQSNNQQFNAQAEANTDGLVNLSDTFLLGPRLTVLNADNTTVSDYNTMINTATVTGGTYTVDANHTVYNVTAKTTNVLAGNTLNARSIRSNDSASALNIANNAIVQIAASTSGGATSKVAAVNLTGTGKIDVADNDLAITSESVGVFANGNYSGVTGKIRAGGITSALANASNHFTALGVARAGDVIDFNGNPTATFSGVTVDANTTLIKYTYGGDGNLTGNINIDDYTLIDVEYDAEHSQSPTFNLSWRTGDYDLNGKINIDDYSIIDTNYRNQGFALAPSLLAELSVTPVPEPASIAAASIGVALLIARRRRA